MKRPDPARPYIRALWEKNCLLSALTAALAVLGIPATLIVSWLLGAVVDAVTAGDTGGLVRLLGAGAGVTVLLTAQETLYFRALGACQARALGQYKSCAFQRLTRKGISAFGRENTGRYLSVLTADPAVIAADYVENTFDLILMPLAFAATLVFLLVCSPALTGAAVVLCVLPFLGATLFGPELARRERALSDAGEGFTSRLRDLLAGFAVIKSFRAEPEAASLFDRENRDLERARSRRLRWRGAMQGVGDGLSVVMQLGLFFAGAFLALRGRITLGTVLIFTNQANALIQPVRTIPQLLAQRRAARGLIEKLASVTEENAARSGESAPTTLNDAIVLDHVTCGWGPDKPVLREVSLRLEAGRSYALVGASGSGKSTLLSLLMGGCEGYQGSVTLDGRELRDLDPDSLYDLVSLMGQSVFLFDDTLRRNVTMFRDFPQEAVDSAVRRAGLEPVIAEKGEDYPCGQGGQGLSGGERQRVAIARALLRGTPVLLMDEADASLDPETARAVTGAILELRGLTRLVVTHRLDPVLLERYDQIIVLRGGTVAEAGTYRELMARRGALRAMAEMEG